MNKLYTFLLFILLCGFGFAQAPKLINYQGIARDATGAAITNTTIGLSFDILNDDGTVAYSETQRVTTNVLGLFSTQIGSTSGSTLNLVDWENGDYSLQVYIDAFDNGNYVAVGLAQPLASVPYALHAASVPASYSNNVLNIGTHTISLPTPTLNGEGLVTVNSDTGTGANYTISVPPPTLSVNENTLSISNGNSVTIFPQTTVTANPLGIATVSTSGTNSFEINVPAPQLSIVNESISISNGNTIVLPPQVPQTTITAIAPSIASITTSGTNSFNILVPNPQLALNGSSLSIVGSNTINLANILPQTSVTASGIAAASATLSPGLNVFDVNVPLPAFNGSVLSFGSTNTLNIAPTLSLSGTTLYSGLPSNSVNLTNGNPWKIGTAAPISILQTTPGLPVGIGSSTLTAASAMLDVQGTSTLTGAVIKAVNSNMVNTFQVLDIQNAALGGLGMNVAAAASGDAAKFQAFNGYALHTQNNSLTYPAFYAKNNNTGTGAYAGYFEGGIVSAGNGNTAADFALKVLDNGVGQLFGVRNDGALGVGSFAITPGVKLDVNGAVRIADGSQGSGRVFVSNATGTGAWRTSPPAVSFGNLNVASIIASTVPTPLNVGTITFNKQYADTDVDVALYSNLSVGGFSGGANSVQFEIYVDGMPSSNASGVFTIKNQNTEAYASIRSLFSGLATGSHTVTIVAYTFFGICPNVLADIGGFGGKIIIKEMF